MQADDVALLTLTKSDLYAMMDVSYEYSRKWRYTLNQLKTIVLVFGETVSQHKHLSPHRKWTLGNKTVTESTNHRHVGVSLSSHLKNTEKIMNSCTKMRSTLFAIIGSVLKPTSTSPLTLLKLFKTVCIPRALSGCELMSNLSRTEMNMLEVTNRFCLKYIQGTSKRTKTNICLASLGVTSMENIIDKTKLIFLRRLCIAPLHFSVKSLFLKRLLCFKYDVSPTYKGFIADIMRIVNKYDLMKYIELYTSEGYFVGKGIWKHIVNRSIMKHYKEQWSTAVSNDQLCARFISIHGSCCGPLLLWSAATRFPNKLKELSFLVRLCVTTHDRQVCDLCALNCNDFTTHLFCDCKTMASNREHFLDYVAQAH